LDKRLKTPRDIAKRVSVRIIGTTPNLDEMDKKLLPQQLRDDYETICVNITTLLEECGDTKIIAVTSPGTGDGKTTFSVNLATAFARSGRKILLLDGDFRKPDIGFVMKLPPGLRGLQDYLFGMDFERAAYKSNDSNLFILASDSRNSADALSLISNAKSAAQIRRLRDQFDYIIIDTPPVLAFSDALVWSKLADGVIITSFIGHTSKNEIQQAIERLGEVQAKIIGTVVNNVKVSHGYRQYGYGYGYGNSKATEEKRKAHERNAPYTLLSSDSIGGDFPDSQDGSASKV
jgi:receptor protein-tyrosine kinase